MKITRSRRGFTLIETIIAVAIIAILCGIAIPSIISTNKSLSERQEDDYAKSIFLAAQDNLTSLKTNGSLNNLRNDIPANATVYTEDKSALKDNIADILGEEHSQELLEGDIEHQYVYVDKTSDLFERVLPPGSIDSSILGKDITIVFNPVSGDVFFVKYGQNGEYCGSVVSIDSSDNTVTPVVWLENGQENVVKIEIGVPNAYQYNKTEYLNAITFDITVKDSDGNTFTYKNLNFESEDSGFKIDYVNRTVTWVLDSLVSGQSFADRNAGASETTGRTIAAGSDICVNVAYTFTAPTGYPNVELLGSKSATGFGSSIFDDNSNTATIVVSNGRHLQNLNKIDETLASSIAATEGAQVKFRSNILWQETVSYYRNARSIDSFKCFNPLKPSKLFADGSKVTVDGCDKFINQLIVNTSASTSGAAGLFENLFVSVSNLDFLDPIIKGGGNAGVLAGSCGYVEDGICRNSIVISNCHIVVQSNSTGIDKILSGENSVTSGIFADIFGACTVNNSANGSVGLLIGAGYNTTITDCTVGSESTESMSGCVIPSSGKNFGLVIGYARECTLQNITANGIIMGGQCSNIGGAVGTAYSDDTNHESGRFESVNACVDILNITSSVSKDTYACPSGFDSVGKFVGHVKGCSFKNCSGTGAVEAGKDYQFLGTIEYATVQFSGDLYLSSVKDTTENIVATLNTDNGNYTAKDKDKNMQFIPVANVDCIRYTTAMLPADNNTYTCSSGTKIQYIRVDSYFYKKTTTKEYSVTKLTASDPFENGMKFILATNNGTLLTAYKKIITAAELNQKYQNKEIFRYCWWTGEINIWDGDSFDGIKGDILNRYYRLNTAERYEPNDYATALAYKLARPLKYGLMTFNEFLDDHDYPISNITDIFRYVVTAKNAAADGKISLLASGSLSEDEYNGYFSDCLWQWENSGNATMLKFIGDTPNAYMTINATDSTYTYQSHVALLPDGNDKSWLGSLSPVDMSYSYDSTAGGFTIFREKGLSFTDIKVSFQIKGNDPSKLEWKNRGNSFSSDCVFDAYKISSDLMDKYMFNYFDAETGSQSVSSIDVS